MVRDVLEKNKSYIIKAIQEGKSCKALALEFNCNPGSIWYFLQDYNIHSNYKRSNIYGQQDVYKDLVITLFDKGNSIYNISKQIGISNSTLGRWLATWGYDTSRGNKLSYDKILLKNRWNEVLELHNMGLSQNEIGQQLGYSASQISLILKKHNVDAHPVNIYNVNEQYFQCIDSEYSAYILGWLYSDGNVQTNGKIRIALQEDDKPILEWMKRELAYTGPLYYKKPRKNSPKAQWELCINRKILADQLIKLGCIPKKSMILTFPTHDIVPTHLLCHFVRGYFEGDGSIHKNGVQIVGTYDFCQVLQTKLPCKITNIYQRYKERKVRESSHQLFVGRKSEIKKFIHFLYDDATIYLQRKYDIARQYFLN